MLLPKATIDNGISEWKSNGVRGEILIMLSIQLSLAITALTLVQKLVLLKHLHLSEKKKRRRYNSSWSWRRSSSSTADGTFVICFSVLQRISMRGLGRTLRDLLLPLRKGSQKYLGQTEQKISDLFHQLNRKISPFPSLYKYVPIHAPFLSIQFSSHFCC